MTMTAPGRAARTKLRLLLGAGCSGRLAQPKPRCERLRWSPERVRLQGMAPAPSLRPVPPRKPCRVLRGGLWSCRTPTEEAGVQNPAGKPQSGLGPGAQGSWCPKGPGAMRTVGEMGAQRRARRSPGSPRSFISPLSVLLLCVSSVCVPVGRYQKTSRARRAVVQVTRWC